MADLHCYSYVEDEPSRDVLIKMVQDRNARNHNEVCFLAGFPKVTRGNQRIQAMCQNFLEMSKFGVYTITLTDLDIMPCAPQLIRKWFFAGKKVPVNLPSQVIFRIAVREIESWILADRAAWAKYIGIPASNFSPTPEALDDPKKHIFNVLRRKGNTKKTHGMLPQGSAHIGPTYNSVICDFIRNHWSVRRAREKAPSLQKAMAALERL